VRFNDRPDERATTFVFFLSSFLALKDAEDEDDDEEQ